jgi:hypothetical protein
MPDFERLLDSLAIHAATDPLERARLEGFRQGKTQARIEIAVICAGVVMVYCLSLGFLA